MRILQVTPRYGEGVAGGAETACRSLSERLVERGHRVAVITSCATTLNWGDEMAPGRSSVNGVDVERLPIREPRNPSTFAPLLERVLGADRSVPYHLQRRLVEQQGPRLAGYSSWIRREAPSFDVVVLHTYLYPTTTVGLAGVARRRPTLLHPTAHDEAMFWLPYFDTVLPAADGVFFHTEEEEELFRRRFPRLESASEVIGLGLPDPAPTPATAAFRRRYALGDDPYVLVLGRIDALKGTLEAHEYVETFVRRHDARLRVVLMGQQHDVVTPTSTTVVTGLVDDATKAAALAGATVLVAPSYFESFSLVLCEAWSYGVPALVQGANPVLRGQATRARAGLAYCGYREFEACLEALLLRPDLGRELGLAGRRYVQSRYRWSTVVDRYEGLLDRTAGRWAERRSGR